VLFRYNDSAVHSSNFTRMLFTNDCQLDLNPDSPSEKSSTLHNEPRLLHWSDRHTYLIHIFQAYIKNKFVCL